MSQIIAIDGPAGAGKSTIAAQVAQRLGYQLIDTGAIYRVVAHKAQEQGIDLNDAQACARVAQGLEFAFAFEEGVNRITCNGEPVGQEIRTPQAGQAASVVSAHGPVRDALLELQRSIGRARPSVLEGRDIGTVVFPDARCKIFLTASPQERAQRRLEQMKQSGQDTLTYDQILEEIQARDTRDATRALAPLKPAPDAHHVDTTSRGITDIVEEIVARAQG